MKQIDNFIMQDLNEDADKFPFGLTNTTVGNDEEKNIGRQEDVFLGRLRVQKKSTKKLSEKDKEELTSLFFSNEKDQVEFKKYIRKKQIKKQKNYYKYQKIWKNELEQKTNLGAYFLNEKNVLKLNMDFQSDSEEQVASYDLPHHKVKLSFIDKKKISTNYSLQNFCISLKSLLEQNKFKRIHKVFKCHLCNSYYQQQSLQEHLKQHNTQNKEHSSNQSSNKLRDFCNLYFQHQTEN